MYFNAEPTALVGHEVIHQADRSSGTRAMFTGDSKKGSRLLRVRCDIAAYSRLRYQFIPLCNCSALIGHLTPPIDASLEARLICRDAERRVYEMTDWSRYPSSSVRDASDWRALCLFALRMITWYFTARGLPGRSLVLLLVPTVQLRQLLDSEASTLSDLFARRSHRERLFRQMESERTTEIKIAHSSIWPAFRSTLTVVIPTRYS